MELKLFYCILGATPKGRNTEQHDVFFGIAESMNGLTKPIKNFWKEAAGKIHVDGYQEVKFVDGFKLKIDLKTNQESEQQLFFINLGGYKSGTFEELHEKHLMVGKSLSEVTKRVKKTNFYKTMGFKSAESHIDDKYGVDIDDIFKVNDILPLEMKEKYAIILEKTDEDIQENLVKVGYYKLGKF